MGTKDDRILRLKALRRFLIQHDDWLRQVVRGSMFLRNLSRRLDRLLGQGRILQRRNRRRKPSDQTGTQAIAWAVLHLDLDAAEYGSELLGLRHRTLLSVWLEYVNEK